MDSFSEYVDMYGLHFNGKLYEWVVSQMRDRAGNKISPQTKEQVSEWLRAKGVKLTNDKGHDACYVLAMARADYYGSSIADEGKLALFVKDYLDDPDGTPTKAFDHFVIDCRSKSLPVFWDEML